MVSVVASGGHQYVVDVGQAIKVEKLDVQVGEFVDLEVISGFKDSVFVRGGSVKAKVLEHIKGPKLIYFKKRRRKNSRRKGGHRQMATVLRVADL